MTTPETVKEEAVRLALEHGFTIDAEGPRSQP